MKIAPVNLSAKPVLKQINFASLSLPSGFREQKSERPKLPSEIFKTRLLVSKQYTYKPIASVKPNFEPVGHYDDLDKFAELFAQKINSQLMIPTEEDIENLINRVQFKTKASRKTIKEVLYDLTAFSGYRAFNELSKTVKKHGIKRFSLNGFSYNSPVSDSLTGCAVDYLAKYKEFCNCEGNKIALILDNETAQMLENLKKSTDPRDIENYKIFIEDLKSDNIVFLNLKGWNIKTAKNGYKSANFLTGSGYLEDLAIETVRSLQNGQEEDKIYYSDFRERLYELLGDDVDKEKIQIETVCPQDNKKDEIKTSDILDNIKPKSMTKEIIKAYIKSYLHFKRGYFEKESEAMSPLLKYLDEMTCVFSIDSLANALKNLHGKIEQTAKDMGEDINNLSYIVPDGSRSFGLISAMYANVNDIDSKNFDSLYYVRKENKPKTKVVLDDISASGTTEKKVVCNYRIYQDEKSKIIYSPVILCKKALNSEDNELDQPDGHICEIFLKDLSEIRGLLLERQYPDNEDSDDDKLNEQIQETIKKDFRILTEKDLYTIFNKIDKGGYGGLRLSVMFPYMIPDNSTDLASLLFKNLLYYENSETNKPLSKMYDCNRQENVVKTKCEQIDEYAQTLISSGKV